MSSVEMLDTAQPAAAWVSGPPLPTDRAYLGVAAVGTAVYAVGGEHNSGALVSVQVLDTLGGTGWRAGPNMTTGRVLHGLAAAGAKLYAAGALADNGTMLASVEVLDTQAPPTPSYHCVDGAVCTLSPTPTSMNLTQCVAMCHHTE